VSVKALTEALSSLKISDNGKCERPNPPPVGYTRPAGMVKRALREQKTIIDVVREEKLLTEEQIAQILDPVELTEPGLPGR
jgi:aspartate ammonia-lyase